MNKKQIKKEQEKLRKERNQVYMNFNDKQSIKNVVFISLGVLGFLTIVFVTINIFNGNWNLFTKKTDSIDSIDSSLVICGTMLDKGDTEYLVIAYNFDDEEQTIYPALKDSYTGTTEIYLLDLDSGFNKTCIGDKNNIVSDLNKIKISTPTLMRIKSGKIIKSYTTEDSIKDYITKLK